MGKYLGVQFLDSIDAAFKKDVLPVSQSDASVSGSHQLWRRVTVSSILVRICTVSLILRILLVESAFPLADDVHTDYFYEVWKPFPRVWKGSCLS